MWFHFEANKDAIILYCYSVSGDSNYLAIHIKIRNIRLKVHFVMWSFILKRIKVHNILIMSKASNSLSPQELVQCVAALPNYIHCTGFLSKEIICTFFKGQNLTRSSTHSMFLIHLLQYYLPNIPISSFRWRFITHVLCAIPVCTPHFYSTSLTLFHGLGTISEKRNCSQALCTDWAKSPCAVEQEGCCTVLKLEKSHKPKSSVGIYDFNHALRTSTDSALSVSCAICSCTDTSTLTLNDTSDRWTGNFCWDCILPTHHRNTRTILQFPLSPF